MISANTRSTRSRISSPALAANGADASKAAKGGPQKNFLERWLEPQVQSKPSFQEAGLIRQGVVENMAPLGTLPKPSTTRKTQEQQPTQPVRRIILKTRDRSEPKAATPKESTMAVADSLVAEEEAAREEMQALATPTLLASEPNDPDQEPSLPPITLSSPSPLPTTHHHKGNEPTTATKPKIPTMRVKITTRKNSPKQTSPKSPDQQRSSPALATSPSPNGDAAWPEGVAPASTTAESKEVADRVGEVVIKAVREAVDHSRFPTAWALRTLYDENVTSPKVMGLFDQVIKQTASDEAVAEFLQLVSTKKREGKKTNKCRTLAPVESTSQPKAATYGDLVKLDVARIAASLAAPRAAAVSEADADGHKAKKQKTTAAAAHSPVPKTPTKSKARTLAAMTTPANGPKTPGSRHRRRISDDSLSSLSPAPSDLDIVAGEVDVAMVDAPPAAAEAPEPEEPTIASPTPLPSTRRRKRQSRQSTAAPLEDSGAAVAGDSHAESTSAATGTSTGTGTSKAAQAVAAQPITGGRRKSRRGNAAAAASMSTRTTRTGTGTLTLIRTPTPNPPPPPRSTTTTPPRSTDANPADDVDARMSAAAALAASTADADASIAQLPNQAQSAPRRGTRNQARNSSPPTKFASKVGVLDENDPKARLRRDAKNFTNSIPIPESFSRVPDGDVTTTTTRPQDQPPPESEPPAPAPAATPTPPVSVVVSAALSTPTGAQSLRRGRVAHQPLRSTRSARKRSHDEIEDDFSPSSSVFPPPLPNGPTSSAVNSRAGTPAPRPAKKARSGLRVKNSPMKKKTGPSAGLPRASGERSSPVPFGLNSSQDDNDDYCASCSGNGELLCCETCTRAFHFKCVDPPVKTSLPDEWHCNVCFAERRPASVQHPSGVFRALITSLNSKNSSAFQLPADIKEYFVGVRAGPDGEYEESVPPVPKKKKPANEEPPDFYRIRDPEGNAVICHACDSPAANDRAIIPCNLCSLYWHLDCLDPPLAVPPVLRTWRCPAHVDNLLADLPSTLAPAHKRRRIKGASAIRPAYSRGMKNNGYIEIEDDDFDAGPPGPNAFGADHKLQADGLVKDFVDCVRRKGNRAANSKRLARGFAPHTSSRGGLDVLADASLSQRSLHSGPSQAMGAGSADKTGLLVAALIAGAEDKILSGVSPNLALDIAKGSGLRSTDKSGLQAMLAQLEQLASNVKTMLASDGSRSVSPAVAASLAAQDEPPSSSMAIDSPPATMPQLTEGTEKSTPEAEEELPVVTPMTEPEANSPIKEDVDVAMTEGPPVAPTNDDDMVNGVPAIKSEDKKSGKGDVMPTPSTSPAENTLLE